MERFRYIGKKLFCENVDVAEIAEKVGTPFYLYSQKKIEENYRALDTALKGIPHLICYSYKANSNLTICRILKTLGAGADIVSGGELYKAIKAGVAPEKIIFAGVGKTEEEIRYAIKTGILMFNVESVEELNFINEIAGRMKRVVPVALRVNFGFDPHTHGYINTGKGSKFGIDISIARGVFAFAKVLKNVEVTGLHSHIGSQITEVEPFKKNLQMALKLAEDLKELKIKLRYINLGGGLGISYRDTESPVPLSQLGRIYRQLLEGTHYTLILEPGRFIAGNAGILVTRVLYTKESFHKKFVIVDAGMNDLIRPSLYNAFHRILPVEKSINREVCKLNIVGPVCETGDFFALDRTMSLPVKGDLLAVMEAGAYGFEMSSNYNSRCRVAQVLVKGRQFSIIKKRQEYSDLIRGEN